MLEIGKVGWVVGVDEDEGVSAGGSVEDEVNGGFGGRVEWVEVGSERVE